MALYVLPPIYFPNQIVLSYSSGRVEWILVVIFDVIKSAISFHKFVLRLKEKFIKVHYLRVFDALCR